MKFVTKILAMLCLFAQFAIAAESATLGTCVVFKVAPNRTVSKAFIPSYTEEQCKALANDYDEVKWAPKSVNDVINEAKGCNYTCSFPCIDYHACNCALDTCH
jgi:hypothetical protein